MFSNRAGQLYILALILSDAVLLTLAFVGAALLRGAVDILPVQPSFEADHYAAVALALIPGLITILWLHGAYDRATLLGGPEEYVRVLSACTYGTLLVVGVSYIYGSLPLVSRGWLLFFWILAVALVGSGRFTLRRIAHALRHRGYFIRRVLVAGANNQGLAIAQQLHSPIGQGVEVVGLLDDFVAPGTSVAAWEADQCYRAPVHFVVRGHPRQARAIAAASQADLLVAVPSALSWESQQLMAHLAELNTKEFEVRLAPTQYDLDAAQVQAAPLGFVPLVRIHPARIIGVDALLRAAVDRLLAALLLAALAPALFWVIAVARCRGIRPLLMSQRVLGERGRPVSLYVLNPRVSSHLLLRGLPALLAVLQSRLALVGPRPVPVDERSAYERWFGLLLRVKPGLTGPWRLASPQLSLEERVLADIWWVRNWSIWQHLFVLSKTIHSLGNPARRDATLQRWAADLPPVEARAPAS